VNDYDAIRNLLAEYCFGTDAGDTDRWLSTMSEDVLWDGGEAFGRFEGHDALRAFHSGSGGASRSYRHLTVNADIRVEGETARSYSYILLLHQAEALSFAACLFYEDDLVKRGGAWRIKRRVIHTAPPALPAGF
jgi:hypothetical protein